MTENLGMGVLLSAGLGQPNVGCESAQRPPCLVGLIWRKTWQELCIAGRELSYPEKLVFLP